MVWEIFSCSVHGTGHTSMPADTANKTTQDQDDQAPLAQVLPLATTCVKDAAYSRITTQEEYERGDQKRSWALFVDNSPQKWAAHVHPN